MPIWHQSPKLTPRYFLETPRLFGYPIEAVPDENDSMMIGLDDFNFPQEEIEEIKNEITII